MHNMIIEQKLDDACVHDKGWQFQDELVELEPRASMFEEFLCMNSELHDSHIHDSLQAFY
jgi:hypothetical protein